MSKKIDNLLYFINFVVIKSDYYFEKNHDFLVNNSNYLFFDQWLKIYTKTNIQYGEGFDILGLNWAKIHFVENPGMAFGFSFGGEIGK